MRSTLQRATNGVKTLIGIKPKHTQGNHMKDTAGPEEEKEWIKLEEKLNADTVHITPIQEKRAWFRETQGWYADDITVKKTWKEHHE